MKDELLSESPAPIRKESARVTSERYQTAKTIPLIFHFDPQTYRSIDSRLKHVSTGHHSVEGKDIYVVDHFFSQDEEEELRTYSGTSTFSRTIFADAYSKEKGEEPAKAMDNKEKWNFFASPPQAVKELFKFLCVLSHKLNADITTLPWELYDHEICAPAVATNRIDHLSVESMNLGKHKDFDTVNGVSFGIPVLYGENNLFHPAKFVNGDIGKPWLVSLMLYATDKDFDPANGLGTVFCDQEKNNVFEAECRNGRFILFEGDIIHGIAHSNANKHAWRVSYVFKLTINPRAPDADLRRDLQGIINSRGK